MSNSVQQPTGHYFLSSVFLENKCTFSVIFIITACMWDCSDIFYIYTVYILGEWKFILHVSGHFDLVKMLEKITIHDSSG